MRYLFLLFFLFSSFFKLQAEISCGRLLVNIDAKASFSSEEFSKKTNAKLIFIEPRNPFKGLDPVFMTVPFAVLSSSIGTKNLSNLASRYGYRFVHFTQETLEEAILETESILKSIPFFSGSIPSMLDCDADQIYDLMEKVDFIFNKHQIKYFVTAGTLLGAIRHKGLIPWDDDLDICLFEEDEEKLNEIKKDLDQMDLALTYCNNGYNFYKIYPKNGLPILDDEDNPHEYLYPFLDIFILCLEKNHEEEDIYVHKSPRFYAFFNKEKFYFSDIENQVRAPFGPTSIWIPEKFESVLNACYGIKQSPGIWKNYAVEPVYSHKLDKTFDQLTKRQGSSFVKIDNFTEVK